MEIGSYSLETDAWPFGRCAVLNPIHGFRPRPYREGCGVFRVALLQIRVGMETSDALKCKHSNGDGKLTMASKVTLNPDLAPTRYLHNCDRR